MLLFKETDPMLWSIEAIVAFWEVHVSVEGVPCGTVAGFAVNVPVGGQAPQSCAQTEQVSDPPLQIPSPQTSPGGVDVTVTVTFAVAVPPFPMAVSV